MEEVINFIECTDEYNNTMTQPILVTAKGELRSFKEGTKLPEKPQLKRFEEAPDDNEREEAYWEFNMEKELWLTSLEAMSTPIHTDSVERVKELVFKLGGPIVMEQIPGLYHIEAEFEVEVQYKSATGWYRSGAKDVEYREVLRLEASKPCPHRYVDCKCEPHFCDYGDTDMESTEESPVAEQESQEALHHEIICKLDEMTDLKEKLDYMKKFIINRKTE